MSSAFVKEGEARHPIEVAPNLGALLFFLRVENNGTVIRDEKSTSAKNMAVMFME
jgi:hypothetical protein